MKIALTNGYTSLDTEKHQWVCGSDGERDRWKRYWKGDSERRGKDQNVVKDKEWRNTRERGVGNMEGGGVS